ncbi:hypothetical protein E2562_029773 [Oryza meyeriana var. granulata]|uniref:Uncharacterized protein n=1 Tax=Oryza meyeriana var. granulata TaxID=110450 RepID=A0A6G1E495_9ORYZ|nr:hypothetical protein E2562_029773 [Oryza meyeriana var. granulata]
MDEQEVGGVAWDCGSPLYDSFELERLYHVLESHLMILPFGPDAAAPRMLDHRLAAEVDDEHGAAARIRRRTPGRKAVAAICRAVACWRTP